MLLNDEYFLNKFYCVDGRLKGKIKPNEDELNYLMNIFDGVLSYKESLYMIKHNISEVPKCPICGNLRKFNGVKFCELIPP